MSTTYLVLDHTEGSASEATSSVVESRQLRDQPFRIYRVVPELDKITVYARHVFYDLLDNMIKSYKPLSRRKSDNSNCQQGSDQNNGSRNLFDHGFFSFRFSRNLVLQRRRVIDPASAIVNRSADAYQTIPRE